MKAVIFTHVLYLILIRTFTVKGVTKCESKVELRAVLLSCPAKDSGCDDDDPLSQAMKSEESQILQADSKNFESSREEKERGFPNAVKDCKRKLVITLKVKNVGKIPCDDEYIVVDHVFDPVTGGRGRLLSPVVVKLRQEQMIQLYGLQFQRVVNGDPFEEQKAGDKTCSVDPENPTCGIAMYDGKPIPFSEGFCCSCDPHVNAKRQLSPVSRGDSLLYRDSKLISQGNARFLGEGKPAAIVDPELVRLKTASPSETSGDKGGDCGGLGDPLRWDRVPNYLLERDRKIVCDKGHFMKELCKSREENARKEAGPTKESEGLKVPATERGGSPSATVGIDADSRVSEGSNAGEADGVSVPADLVEGSNADRCTSSAPPAAGGGPAKGGRGKRENRTESKKLTLEEKLERFASSKKHLKNRRKRLLELSHGRFRKAEDRCKNGPESQKITVKGCSPGEYLKAAPPRYFFSHDRAIIDPLENVDVMMNSTCKSLREEGCEDASKDKTYGPSGKSGAFKTFRDRKEKLIDRAFYRRRPSGEDETAKKEKFLVGKINGKKDKASHAEGGRMEGGSGKEREMRTQDAQGTSKEAASSGSDARFSPCKGGGRKEGENENAEGKEENEETTERGNDREALFGPKNFKSFLRKGEREKKPIRPKIRNFFMTKNKEKQKFRSEFVKAHKKEELRKKEGLDEEKRRERLRAKGDDVEGGEPDEKETESGNEKVAENEENPSALQLSTEKYDFNVPRFLFNEEISRGKEKYNEERKHAKESLKKKPQDSRFHARKDVEGNINFNLEIIRSQLPGISKRRHHAIFAEQHAKARMDASALGPKTNAYSLNGKTHRLKANQNQFLRHPPTQKYYVLGNENFYPREAFRAQSESGRFSEIKSRPRSDAAAFDSARPKNVAQPRLGAHFRKKPDRRYYVAAGDYTEDEPNPSPPREPLRPGAGDESPELLEIRPREKRLSEPSRERQEDDVAIAGLPESIREVLLFRPDEVRSKRSTPYGFRPALGFYESDVDSRETNERVVHELEICPAEAKARKRGPGGWTGPRFAPAELANLSTDASAFSFASSREPRTGLDRPTSRETTRREKNGMSDSDEQRLIRSYLNAPDYVLEEVESALEGKRQSSERNKAENSREGPACDKYSYGGDFAQDTAHCMRFGDLWYGLYAIEKPVVSQIVGVQLFDKHSLCDGTAQWRDLTKGKMIRIGTFFSKAEDELPTLSLSFMGEKTKRVESSIDPDDYFLLIPSHVSDPSKVNSYPQFEGGPAEYLLVRPKDVSSGGECNAVGTSFEAFARQPDRCARRRGSCLKRQPVDLWREDMEARIRGKRGKYFVENFGNVPNSPVKTYTNLTGEFLALEYYGDYTSTIEIEVKADSNAIIRKGSNAQIPLVYVDSTHPKKTRIVLSVLNIGLTSSYFRPRLGDCPPDLDPAWCPLEGPLVTIPPQQRHDFKLDLSGPPPAGQIFLTVQVLNQVNKKIALRKIIIKRGDRCVCAFHCKCNCVGNGMGGRTCRRLGLEEYRKAGYIGSYPFRGGAAASAPDSIFGNVHVVFLTASYLLLFLGVTKGILGIFVRRIGIAGTRIITGPRELCGYYECELRGCSVLYDECGFPVHPTTCRPVQIVPLWLETILNFFFFFLYPSRGIWFLLLSLPCRGAFSSDFDGFGRRDEGDRDRKCSRPLLSKRADPTCVHYNLTTVDSKKSQQEYLPCPAYKGDDDPLEEDDTEFVLREMKKYRKK